MGKRLKRILSVLLAAAMLISSCPVSVFAEENDTEYIQVSEGENSLSEATNEVEEIKEEIVEEKEATSVETETTLASDSDATYEEESITEASSSDATYENEFPKFNVTSEEIDGVKVTVTAEAGVFPAGSKLSVKKVLKSNEDSKDIEAAVDNAKLLEDEDSDEDTTTETYTFDIKVLDKEGNEVEPKDSASVNVKFELVENKQQISEAKVYHLEESDESKLAKLDELLEEAKEEEDTFDYSLLDGEVIDNVNKKYNKANDIAATLIKAEEETEEAKEYKESNLVAVELETSVKEDTNEVVATTEGFSYYVVEITYNTNKYNIGLNGKVSVEEIIEDLELGIASPSNVVSSDPTSVEVTKEGSVWFVEALKAFTEAVKLTLTYGEAGNTTDIEMSFTANGPYVCKVGEKSYATVNAAINDNTGTFTITMVDDFTITDTARYISIPASKTVTLDLAGHSIIAKYTVSTNNGIIKVAGSGFLTIKDSAEGGIIKLGDGTGMASINSSIIVNAGTTTLQGGTLSGGTGTVIKECSANLRCGGGVYNDSGIFKMEGGKIQNSRANCGGGIHNNSGTLILVGGEITQCTAGIDGVENSGGGGIRQYGDQNKAKTYFCCLPTDTINTKTGVITPEHTDFDFKITNCNTAGSRSGGAMYEYNGIVYLNDGTTISGCGRQITEGNNSAGNGAAFFVTNAACFYMFGGLIKDCDGVNDDPAANPPTPQCIIGLNGNGEVKIFDGTIESTGDDYIIGCTSSVQGTVSITGGRFAKEIPDSADGKTAKTIVYNAGTTLRVKLCGDSENGNATAQVVDTNEVQDVDEPEETKAGQVNLHAVTKTGYNFIGWEDEEGTIYQPGTYYFSKTHTFTEKLEAKTYTVYLDNKNDEQITSINVTYDQNMPDRSADIPSKAHYTFAGYFDAVTDGTKYINADGSSAKTWDKDIDECTLYAHWDAMQYTISFDSKGGTAVDSKTAGYGETVQAPTDPTKEGYTFAGWFNGDAAFSFPYVMQDSDISLEAHWTPVNYTISFDSRGGSEVPSITQGYKTSVQAPTAPTKTGHDFAGWLDANDAAFTFPHEMPLNGIALHADWTVKQYTITFNSNGGTSVDPITADYDSDISAPTAPTKSGYDFDAWYINNGLFDKKYTFSKMPAENKNLIANWIAKTYTVALDSQGAETKGTESVTATYNLAMPSLAALPSKTGYTFQGYFSSTNGEGTQYYDASGISTNSWLVADGATLYAYWTQNATYPLTIKYVDENDNEIRTADTRRYELNAAYSISAPEISGYTGPTSAITGTMDSEGKTETIHYTTNSYQITFVSNGGSDVTPITADYKEAVSAPTNPTREGYTFDGWYIDDKTFSDKFVFSTMPLGGATVYAKWNINQYTITVETNGGSVVAPITQNFGTAVSTPTTTKDGSTFDGWYANEGLTEAYTFTTMPAENITVYAKWTQIVYTMSFVSNEGSSVADIKAVYGAEVTKPDDPTRLGHTFAGWFSDSTLKNEYTFTTMPLGGITLYAKWTTNQYTIFVNTNGGTPVEAITRYYGGTIATPTTTKVGSIFAGWYQDEALSQEYEFPATMPVYPDRFTVYAKWTEIPYTITFNSNGGSDVDPIVTTYGETLTKPEDPTKTGYNFVNWYSDAELTQVFDFTQTMPAKSFTLYAKWDAKLFTITVDFIDATSKEKLKKSHIIENVPYNGSYTFTPADITGYTKDRAKISSVAYSDTTEVVTYTRKTYTVTLDGDGATTAGTASVTATYKSALPKVKTLPKKTGYTFGGFYTSKNGGGTQYYDSTGTGVKNWDKTEATTLYAKWTAKEYTVTLNGQDATTKGTESVTATYDAAMPGITAPTKTGYTFGGYYTEAKGAGTQYYKADGTSAKTWDKTEATTLYAKWTANTYTVTLDGNEATTAGTKSVTATFGADMPAIEKLPSKAGFVFDGFYDSKEDTAVKYYNADGSSAKQWDKTAATTLYAKWSKSTAEAIIDGKETTGTLADILEAATIGQTVKLLNSVDQHDTKYTVKPGITLDIAGNTLTAKGILLNGSLADTGNGDGAVILDGSTLSATGNPYMPICDAKLSESSGANAYRLFRYAIKISAADPYANKTDYFKLKYRIYLYNSDGSTQSKKAYELLAAGDGASKLLLTAGISLPNSSGVKTDYEFNYTKESTRSYGTQKSANVSKEIIFYLSLQNYKKHAGKVIKASSTWTVDGGFAFDDATDDKYYKIGTDGKVTVATEEEYDKQ